jgi:hypothetical protein
VSDNIYNEVIKLAKDFCKEIDKEYFDAFEKEYCSEQYKKVLESCERGDIVEHKIAFEERILQASYNSNIYYFKEKKYTLSGNF